MLKDADPLRFFLSFAQHVWVRREKFVSFPHELLADLFQLCLVA